jgi:hypothetical protein
VNATMMTNRTAIPAPIAIFFQAFIGSVSPRRTHLRRCPDLPERLSIDENVLLVPRCGGHTISVTVLPGRKFPIKS